MADRDGVSLLVFGRAVILLRPTFLAKLQLALSLLRVSQPQIGLAQHQSHGPRLRIEFDSLLQARQRFGGTVQLEQRATQFPLSARRLWSSADRLLQHRQRVTGATLARQKGGIVESRIGRRARGGLVQPDSTAEMAFRVLGPV